jgi:hypothetical protein
MAPRTLRAGALALGVTLALAGCGDDAVVEELRLTDADQLYGLDVVPTFSIDLDAAAWAALDVEPKKYVRGRFRAGDIVLDEVGVRLKGNFSLTALDEKPSFKISFDRYRHGQRFLGLEAMVLNNLWVDPSMVREWIGYRVFRELDVPAPRAGYAVVFVNGLRYGVYLDLEAYSDDFLERVYADPSGQLYEEKSGADLDRDVALYDLDEGKDDDFAELQRFADLARAPGDDVFYAPDTVLDRPRALAYLLGEAYVGHFDGYYAVHNYFIYHEPTVDLWTWLPWSLDQAFVRRISPFASKGYLSEKCVASERCRVELIQAGADAVRRLDALELERDVERIATRVEPLARLGDHRQYGEKQADGARAGVFSYLRDRPAELAVTFDCLVDGADPDDDGDGWGRCYHDCDDSDPDVHPKVPEVCDDIDNDCTGYADDDPSCPCPSETIAGRAFYFCPFVIPWRDAERFCAEAGLQLARFTDLDQARAVSVAAGERDPGLWSIGLSDEDEEGEYRFRDGALPGFSDWAPGEPAHALEWFDCVFVNSPGRWVEGNCIEQAPFVCSE